MNAWYIDTERDKSRIEIKGGSRFSNPFRQLKSYRHVMYEVIEKNIILHSNLYPSKICAVNLFSGPIELNRKIPGNLPYYKITQESDFYNFLYDYNSRNSFTKESADALNAIFPAEMSEWPPKSYVDRIFNITQWTEMTSGGHFAALEEPDRLVNDLVKFSRTVR